MRPASRLEGKDGLVLEQGVQRLREQEVEVEVEPSVVVDGEVAEEVDPLDGVVGQPFVQGEPRGHPLSDEGQDVFVREEDVAEVGVEHPHLGRTRRRTRRRVRVRIGIRVRLGLGVGL